MDPFVQYCKRFLDEFQAETINTANAKKFIRLHDFEGRKSCNLERKKMSEILNNFIQGETDCKNKTVGDLDSYITKKIETPDLKPIKITEKEHFDFSKVIIEEKDNALKYFKTDIRKRTRDLAKGIDKIKRLNVVLEKLNFKLGNTHKEDQLEFLYDLTKRGYLVGNYTEDTAKITIICSKIRHNYNVVKTRIDYRLKSGQDPCGDCGEDTRENNPYTRKQEEDNYKRTVKRAKFLNCEIVNYDYSLKKVKVPCPSCKTHIDVDTTHFQKWKSCLRCINKINGARYTQAQVESQLSRIGIYKCSEYNGKDEPLEYSCPCCGKIVSNRYSDIRTRDPCCIRCQFFIYSGEYNGKNKKIYDKLGVDRVNPVKKIREDYSPFLSAKLSLDKEDMRIVDKYELRLPKNIIFIKERLVKTVCAKPIKIRKRPLKSLDDFSNYQDSHKEFYTLLSGKILKIQGYEKLALVELEKINIKGISNDEIRVKYKKDEGYDAAYFPDLYVKSLGLIIEVKSLYTFFRGSLTDVKKLLKTAKCGFNVELWILTEKHSLLKSSYIVGIRYIGNKFYYSRIELSTLKTTYVTYSPKNVDFKMLETTSDSELEDFYEEYDSFMTFVSEGIRKDEIKPLDKNLVNKIKDIQKTTKTVIKKLPRRSFPGEVLLSEHEKLYGWDDTVENHLENFFCNNKRSVGDYTRIPIPPGTTKLYVTFFDGILKEGIIPSSVTHLTLDRLDSPLTKKSIPYGVTNLCLDFNQPLSPGVIPSSVTCLEFGSMFDQHINIDCLPVKLKTLVFREKFTHSISHLKEFFSRPDFTLKFSSFNRNLTRQAMEFQRRYPANFLVNLENEFGPDEQDVNSPDVLDSIEVMEFESNASFWKGDYWEGEYIDFCYEEDEDGFEDYCESEDLYIEENDEWVKIQNESNNIMKIVLQENERVKTEKDETSIDDEYQTISEEISRLLPRKINNEYSMLGDELHFKFGIQILIKMNRRGTYDVYGYPYGELTKTFVSIYNLYFKEPYTGLWVDKKGYENSKVFNTLVICEKVRGSGIYTLRPVSFRKFIYGTITLKDAASFSQTDDDLLPLKNYITIELED
jgi:hypothetical protein